MDRTITTDDLLRRFAPACYATAALLFLIPFSEYGAQLQWTFEFSSVEWRVGAVGLLSALVSPVFALFLAMITAHLLGHTRNLQILAAASILGCILIGGILGIFALDLLQVRAIVIPEMKRAFTVAGIKAVINFSLMFATLGIMGVTGWKAARRAVASETASARGREGSESILLARNAAG